MSRARRVLAGSPMETAAYVKLGEHVVPACRRLWDLLEDVPVLDDLAILLEEEDVDACRVRVL
jgi:hypothetical protein